MISEFPNFDILDLHHRDYVESFVKKYAAYSDFNFTSLYTWNVNQKTALTRLNGNLVVRFSDYITGEIFYSFIGDKKLNETALTLLDYISLQSSIRTHLSLVPEHVTNKLDDSVFEIHEDRDNFDYIYTVADLAESRGKKYETIRNLCNRLLRRNKDIRLSVLDIDNKTHLDSIFTLLSIWEAQKNEDIGDEVRVFKKMCRYKHDNIRNVAVYSGDTLIGITFYELLDNGHALAHYVKADRNFSGIFVYMLRELAKILHCEGYLYLNYEQDVGQENLRKSKESYRPSSFLKKYHVRKR